MKLKTNDFGWFILYWFVMYILAVITYTIRYPDSPMDGEKMNNYLLNWLQLTIATFALYKLARGDWLGNRKK